MSDAVKNPQSFVFGIAACALAAFLPSVTHAAEAVRRIGVLDAGAPSDREFLEAEHSALRALGWFVGRNLVVERRNADGKAELLKPMAEDLVRRKVEIIVAYSTAAAVAAKSVTSTIPIIAHSADPVGAGLVASFSRPGGNVTGLSVVGFEIDAKRLSLLRELVPGLRRVGVLEDSTNAYYRSARAGFERSCKSLGVEPIFVEFGGGSEVDSAVGGAVRQGAQALFIGRAGPYWVNRAAILGATRRHALPVTAGHESFLESGALLTYGNADNEQLEREAAFVDKILRGAKPADLPVEQPTRFELGVNLGAARMLGLVVPQSVLLQATKVIQ